MNPVGGRRDTAWAGKIGKMDVRRSLSHAEDKHSSVDLLKLQDKYNLKGFEFGNYTSNDDRHDFAIATKRSLEDLMFVLRTKNIGMDRLVGIAFGARGMGGRAAAHYEPGFNMINLTKPHGAGTLAHEYGHALDFNLGRYIDQNKLHSALSGGSSVARTLESNTGGQLRYWTNKIVDAVKATDSFKRLDKAGDYWRERTEVFARTFEQYVCYALKTEGWTNQFITKSWIQYTTRAAYLREDDFMKILPDMQQLVREISLFLNDKGKLVPRAYPTTAKKVVMPKPEKKAEPKVAAANRAKKETAKQPAKPVAKQPAKAAEKPVIKASPKKAEAVKYKKPMQVQDMFAFSADDKIRPVLGGVHFENGYAISTDGTQMAHFKIPYPKNYEDKTLLSSGKFSDGRYPNWKSVVPDVNKMGKTIIDVEKLEDCVTKTLFLSKKVHTPINFNGICISQILLKNMVNLCKKLGISTITWCHFNDISRPCLWKFNGDDWILTMPLMPRKPDDVDYAQVDYGTGKIHLSKNINDTTMSKVNEAKDLIIKSKGSIIQKPNVGKAKKLVEYYNSIKKQDRGCMKEKRHYTNQERHKIYTAPKVKLKNVPAVPKQKDTQALKLRKSMIVKYMKQLGECYYCKALHNNVYIIRKSVRETKEHASGDWISTLFALNIDSLISEAQEIRTLEPNSKSQSVYDKMHLFICPVKGYGYAKLLIGELSESEKSRRYTHYCITKIQLKELKK